MQTPKMVFVVVKQYAERNAKTWRYAVCWQTKKDTQLYFLLKYKQEFPH